MNGSTNEFKCGALGYIYIYIYTIYIYIYGLYIFSQRNL